MKFIFTFFVFSLLLAFVSATGQSVTVYAANSYSSTGFVFPQSFGSYEVTSTNFTQLWGNADIALKYNPTNNTLITKCATSDGVCATLNQFTYQRIAKSIDLAENSANCLVAYSYVVLDYESYYALWICGGNWKAPSVVRVARAEEMAENKRRFIEAKAQH